MNNFTSEQNDDKIILEISPFHLTGKKTPNGLKRKRSRLNRSSYIERERIPIATCVSSEDDTKIIYKEYESIKSKFSCQMDSEEIYTRFPTGTSSGNILKNRYSNILPNEDNRVKMKDSGSSPSDYFNGSYIQWNGQTRFISTQAPVPCSRGDFWRIVHEQRCPVIIMLTQTIEGGKNKCEVYWPEKEDEEMSFVDERAEISEDSDYESECEVSIDSRPFIKINTKSNNTIHPQITVRRIGINRESRPPGTNEHEVLHIQYTGWPDFGTPLSTNSVLTIIDLMEKEVSKRSSPGPVLVHCSAGVGRTGSFIAATLAREIWDHEAGTKHKRGEILGHSSLSQIVNVREIVCELRRQRCGMVTKKEQYLFIWKTLQDYINKNYRNLLGFPIIL